MNAKTAEILRDALDFHRTDPQSLANLGHCVRACMAFFQDEMDRHEYAKAESISAADVNDSARSMIGGLRNWLVSRDRVPYAFWLGKDGHA